MSRRNRSLISWTLATGTLLGCGFRVPATASAAPAAVATVSPSGLVYTVQKGDSLTRIANQLGVPLADLLSLNHLTRSSVIVPGQHLQVPKGGHLPAGNPGAAQVYTVQKGDSLLRIASKMGVTLDQLLAANGLQKSSVIVPGRQLVVPAGGTLPTTAGTTSSGKSVAAAQTYTVQKGDSLVRIANRMGVTLNQLLEANGLQKTSVIVPGRQLKVPAGGTLPAATDSSSVGTAAAPASKPTTSPAASGQTYTVQKGESFTRIALKLGVSVADLLAVNGLQRHSVIHPGTTLKVPAGGHVPAGAPATGNSQVDTVIAFARAQLGEPYRFNAAGPDAWDCSGLTLAAYAKIGVKLPHYSAAQAKLGTAVDWRNSPIRPGDLVFLESSKGSGVISHVGIAISATQWIQAPQAGDVVRIGNIPTSRIVAVRRFVNS